MEKSLVGDVVSVSLDGLDGVVDEGVAVVGVGGGHGVAAGSVSPGPSAEQALGHGGGDGQHGGDQENLQQITGDKRTADTRRTELSDLLRRVMIRVVRKQSGFLWIL